eukprot:TRINITY_DN993_c0_g1_i1.p1 TRINITY_DN993_c0_g1~~TRINITY_DN993_c0_g1_i1.p1  ORF type:complete len:159 (+),score=18.20 TRINITY_DN993_c0_g1_i1:162-638(+)
MPTTVEVKHEYLGGWSGRIKIGQLIIGILALICCAPGYHSTQHWFLLVASVAFLGTLFFTAFYLFLDTHLKNYNVNWLQSEFWFTAAMTFFYFTAFVAQLAEFAGVTSEKYQYWFDAQVAAGVFGLFNNILYGVGAYFVYLEWKSNPMGPGDALPPAA